VINWSLVGGIGLRYMHEDWFSGPSFGALVYLMGSVLGIVEGIVREVFFRIDRSCTHALMLKEIGL
jgi:hypothetical protein